MASSSNTILHQQLPKLNGKNYHHWSIQKRVMFESQELWDIIEQGFDEPIEIDELTQEQEDEIRDLRNKDEKAPYTIYQAVDEVIFERISSSVSSKDAWYIYKTYRGEDKVKIVRLKTLRCEFDNLKMKDSETVEDFYNRVILVLNQLRLNDEMIEDRRVVENIIRSMTRKFEYVVVAIEESKDLSILSLESLIGTLQSHELRMRQFDSTPYEQAFQLSLNTQERNRFHGKEQQGDLSMKRQRKAIYTCTMFSLSKTWAAKYCRKRIAKEMDNNFMNLEDANEDDTLVMILSTQETCFDDTWYIDSGCSNHMSGNKNIYVSIDDSQKKEVRTGDDKRLCVQGVAEILVDTRDGKKKISNVYFVPGLKHNMLSVGQLRQKGYDLHFKGEACEIKDPMETFLVRLA